MSSLIAHVVAIAAIVAAVAVSAAAVDASAGVVRLGIHHTVTRRNADHERSRGVRRLHELDVAVNGTFNKISAAFFAPKYTVGPVGIGSPTPQFFYLIPDSGSNYLALPEAVTVPADFHKEHQFNASASTSFTADTKHDDIALVYGGGGLYGSGGYDVAEVGGASVKEQGIVLVHKLEGAGFLAPGQYWEGIWGLCFQGLYQNGSNPFAGPGYYKPLAASLYDSGSMATNSIGAFFSNLPGDNTGELLFGGVNEARFTGDLQYVDILPMHPMREQAADRFGYWLFDVDAVQIDGRPTGVCQANKCTGFVDTGGPILNVPLLVAGAAVKFIHVNANCSEVDQNPTFTFVLGGHSFDLGPEFYVYRVPDATMPTGEYCELAVGASGGPSDFLFQFGDPFVRAYYTHFVMGQGDTGDAPQIGFAKAAQE